MAKPPISDERQLDTKERDHLGCERHERLVFSMSPTGSGTPESVAQVVERLALKQQHRGPGSFAASVQNGYTVKVTVCWSLGYFVWEVRRGGKCGDWGLAILRDGAVEQVPGWTLKEPDEQAPV